MPPPTTAAVELAIVAATPRHPLTPSRSTDGCRPGGSVLAADAGEGGHPAGVLADVLGCVRTPCGQVDHTGLDQVGAGEEPACSTPHLRVWPAATGGRLPVGPPVPPQPPNLRTPSVPSRPDGQRRGRLPTPRRQAAGAMTGPPANHPPGSHARAGRRSRTIVPGSVNRSATACRAVDEVPAPLAHASDGPPGPSITRKDGQSVPPLG